MKASRPVVLAIVAFLIMFTRRAVLGGIAVEAMVTVWLVSKA